MIFYTGIFFGGKFIFLEKALTGISRQRTNFPKNEFLIGSRLQVASCRLYAILYSIEKISKT